LLAIGIAEADTDTDLVLTCQPCGMHRHAGERGAIAPTLLIRRSWMANSSSTLESAR
jgi:hypothetical protein